MNKSKRFFGADYNDWGLLMLRLGFGGLMLTRHGLGKLLNLGERFHSFADPIGLGSGLSLILTVGAEFVASIFIIAGLFTRYAAAPLIVTMFVAAFVVHWADSFAKKELALLYLTAFATIAALGPGRISMDGLLRRMRAGTMV